MARRFRNLPEPPAVPGVADLDWFEKVKYNLEILMGQRQGEQNSAAVLRSDVQLGQLDESKIKALKTGQQGVSISGSQVPTLAEYQELQQDVESLREELSMQRVYLNSLIRNLQSRVQ